jgi:hypothetical protein
MFECVKASQISPGMGMPGVLIGNSRDNQLMCSATKNLKDYILFKELPYELLRHSITEMI